MWAMIHGDARHLPLADTSVQCVVTSPPYWGLRDYGVIEQIGAEETADCLGWATGQRCTQCFVCQMVMAFREVHRVLRDDGTCWLNLGDSYVRDPRKGARFRGKSEAYLPDASVTNPDVPNGLKPKDLTGTPWRVALALQADGWYLRSDIIWSKLNPMPESVQDRPTKAHEYVFLLAKSETYYYDAQAIAEMASGAVAGNRRHKYTTAYNTTHDERHRTAEGLLKISGKHFETRNARTVWSLTSQPYVGSHYATMPPMLAERCIKAGSKRRDIILDPFVGAGTTCLVAERLGRSSVGVDLSRSNCTLAYWRVRNDAPLFFQVG